MDKHSLRKALKAVPLNHRAEWDKAICRGISEHPNYLAAKTVYLFCPAEAEPNITPVFADAFRRGMQVCVPVTKGDEMCFVPITRDTEWTEGKFGIREPVPPYNVPKSPDLIITPMVAFDRRLNRLGHGKGYYDRYFAAHSEGFRLGVAYDCFGVDDVFASEYDVPMDDVVTESGRKRKA